MIRLYMLNYKNKYLKYKNKYLQLKKQSGGIHNGKTSTQILNELTDAHKLNKFNVSFDDCVFKKLTRFFTMMKNNLDYLFIPKIFNKQNYIGKRKVTSEDLNKIWYSLSEIPTQGKIVKMIENNKFKIRVKDASGKYNPMNFNGNILFRENQRTGKIKIELDGQEKEINFDANANDNVIISDYINIVTIYRNYMTNNTDQMQISNYAIGNNKLYLHPGIDWVEMEKRLDGMFDGEEADNKIRLIVDDTKTFLYYKKYDILIQMGKDDGFYLIIIPVKKIDNKYEITPYNYKNIIVNDYYYNSVKNLFEVITKKLNEVITDGSPYYNLPDSFFHIHVVDVLNENKIVMVVHAKYEIENRISQDFIDYMFKDSDDKIYNIKRSKPISTVEEGSEEETQLRKIHSFYFLFDLERNEHNLFSTVDASNDITDSEGNTIWNRIALIDASFGTNIADINYMLNRPVILTPYGNTKSGCKVFCPPDTDKYVYDDEYNKCAEIKLKDNNVIFISDILVHNQFSKCKYNFKQIMDKINIKAASIGATQITLDDDAFMQFPDTYTLSDDALYKWSLAFLKKNPDAPSLYYNFGFSMKNKTKLWVSESMSFLKELVNNYNSTNPYDLVLNGIKLGVTKKNLKNRILCSDASKCFANEEEYKTNLETFDREYKTFEHEVTSSLIKFISDNTAKFNDNGWENSWMLEPGNVDTTKFSNIYKALAMDSYVKCVS